MLMRVQTLQKLRTPAGSLSYLCYICFSVAFSSRSTAIRGLLHGSAPPLLPQTLTDWQILSHISAYRPHTEDSPLLCRKGGMGCCKALDGVLDEYVQKKREGRIYVHQGVDGAHQHGFMVPFGT